MDFETLTILLGGFLTLSIYSFLYKDNPLYRFSEHLYVGVSAGYLFARGVNDVLKKKLWGPLVDPPRGVESDYWLLIPIMLGLFMVLKLVPKLSWISRWAIALVVGGTIGLSMTTRFKSDVVKQVGATIAPFSARHEGVLQLYAKLDLASNSRNHLKDLAFKPQLEKANFYHSALYDYLLVELKTEKALLPDGRTQLERLRSVIEVFYEALDLDAGVLETGFRVMLEKRQSFLRLRPLLEAELKKFERAVSNTVSSEKSGGRWSKAISQELAKKEFGYARRMKALKNLAKAEKQVTDILSGFQERLRSLAEASSSRSLPLASANQALPKVQSLMKVFKLSHEVFTDLGQVFSHYRTVPVLLKAFAVEEATLIKAGLSPDLWTSIGGGLPQRVAAWKALVKADLSQPFEPARHGLIDNLVIALGVLTILVYFFFSTEHRGFVGVSAKIGIYFLMICFGSSFGYTIMARVSLLIGRMTFLIEDCGAALRQLVGG
jgi:hypothetical protein